MGQTKGKKTKGNKAKKTVKFTRSKLVSTAKRDAIKRKIDREAVMEPDVMERLATTFRPLRSEAALFSGVMTNPRSLESDEIKAFRFKDAVAQKLIIKELGTIEDSDYGIIDTIHALLDMADFKDTEDSIVYLNVRSTAELSRLQKNISEEDPDLFSKIQFVRSLDAVRGTTDSAPASAAAAAAHAGDDNDGAGVAAVRAARPVMNDEALTRAMGQDPKANIGLIKRSRKYKDVIAGLKKYHGELANYQRELEQKGDSRELFNTHKDTLDGLIADLNTKINLYISTSKTKDDEEDKDVRKDAMEVLQDQLYNIQRENSNTDMDRLREAFWYRNYETMKDWDIDPTTQEVVLGVGNQGEVRTVTYKGPPPFQAGIKVDDPEKSNTPSIDSGIPKESHEQSKRAVSAFRINDFFGMNTIPETRFMVRTNKDTGKIEFGQAIKFVHGTIGQKEGLHRDPLDPGRDAYLIGQNDIARRVLLEGPPDPGLRDTNKDEYDRLSGRYENAADRMSKFEFVAGNYYEKKVNKPVAVDPKLAAVQKGLSDLQMLDNIIGHADRHGENYIFTTDGLTNTITGVAGIDNDDSFGYKWASRDAPYTLDGFPKSSKTPGLPPVIDIETATKLMKKSEDEIDTEMLRLLKDNVPDTDLKATIERTKTKIKLLKDKIKSGEITVATDNDQLPASKLREFEQLAGLTDGFLTGKIKKWGDETEALHYVEEDSADGEPKSEQEKANYAFRNANSYLGSMVALERMKGSEPPEFK